MLGSQNEGKMSTFNDIPVSPSTFQENDRKTAAIVVWFFIGFIVIVFAITMLLFSE